ncbi:Oxoglutarate/iron-dependent dioxygenase [Trema orientale]|uniref:Oxoglutarate/iron-dependent dioxygenase n=1 Tax=Trema orientale TaxID=63057 RepID=A0A2P5FJD2_TREOI|nr:Oxoglutarate/iron-dependent dioxygenase [Trema orientale]
MEEEEKNLTKVSSLVPLEVPIVDLNHLTQNSQIRSIIIDKLRNVCQEMGFFQIINHGIRSDVIEEALGSSEKFFDLPTEDKNVFSSEDVHKPVRFMSFRNNDDVDGGEISREFIKIYAHPIQRWIDSWPHKPADYREKLGKYATQVRLLNMNMMGAIMESLGLCPNHLRESIEQGMQIIAVNAYPQCSSSTISSVGISSHTDHSILSFLVENTSGLEVLDSRDNSWKSLLETKNGLIVLVGNHLELLSNGLYKSVVHRAVRSSQSGTRVSIGSFHSLPMDEMVEPAVELVDRENCPKRYRASSLSDYIKYLSSKEVKPYIESLKI